MLTIEQTSADRAEIQRLAGRLAVQQAKHRYLAETLAAIEASSAWAIARRLSQWRHQLMPDGSLRQRCFRFCVRGLRMWRREGLVAVVRRLGAKLLRRFGCLPQPRVAVSTLERAERLRLAAGTSGDAFRIAFIGLGHACEASSMRYRAHNVLEALALVGVEGTFATMEEVPAKLSTLLAHDLIVLVRLPFNSLTAMVIDGVRRLGRPLVFDIDDYLFDPWVMPYVEAFREMPQAESQRILSELGECFQECDYFTGSTPYLAERAASLGKSSFALANGINATQLQLAHRALEKRAVRRHDGLTRLGYFSGTRTHQADFRVIYPTLMALLRKHRAARLVVVGALDLGEFPGLMHYTDQIETLPLRNWTELPETMASIDINLIPLELTPFNEGKSNLKYFEAGLLKVPSIASPTRIHRDSIVHGDNGLLAGTPQEWHDGLSELMADVDLRKRMGQNAFEHVLRRYAPPATATEALDVYRQILQIHRAKCAACPNTVDTLIQPLGLEPHRVAS